MAASAKNNPQHDPDGTPVDAVLQSLRAWSGSSRYSQASIDALMKLLDEYYGDSRMVASIHDVHSSDCLFITRNCNVVLGYPHTIIQQDWPGWLSRIILPADQMELQSSIMANFAATAHWSLEVRATTGCTYSLRIQSPDHGYRWFTHLMFPLHLDPETKNPTAILECIASLKEWFTPTQFLFRVEPGWNLTDLVFATEGTPPAITEEAKALIAPILAGEHLTADWPQAQLLQEQMAVYGAQSPQQLVIRLLSHR